MAHDRTLVTPTDPGHGDVIDASDSASLAPRRAMPLHDLEHVERELARVYRDARAGRIRSEDGSRFAFMLSTLAKIMETRIVARRLDALERMMEGGDGFA